MNHFEIEGTVWQVVAKVSRTGKRFRVIVIETDGGDSVPLSVWSSPPEKGSRVRMKGRLVGWGDFANPKVSLLEIIREVNDPPSRQHWRKPPDGMQRKRGKVVKPVTGHFEDDDSLPF